MKPLIAVLIGVFAFGAVSFAQDDRLLVKKDPTDSKRLICELKYATFKVPEGWNPNQSGGKTQCILTKGSETHPNLTQMISIDIGKPSDPSVKELSKSLAKMWGGKISETPVTVDGQEGYKVTILPSEKKVQPTNAIVVIKESRVFMLIGAAKSDAKLEPVLEQLLLDWKWKK